MAWKPQFMTGGYIPYSTTRSGVALRMRSCRQLPSPFASPFEADIRSNALSLSDSRLPFKHCLVSYAPVSNVFKFPTFRTKSRPASDEQNSPISSLFLSETATFAKIDIPSSALPNQNRMPDGKWGIGESRALACEAEGHKAVRLESKRKGRSAIPIMSLPEEM